MKGRKIMKKILLRGSWQTKNIGDIAHTPGFLNLAKRFLPDCEIWLWPKQIDLGVREMLLDNFPGLRIVECEAEITAAFEQCDMLVHGSAPIVADRDIRSWKEKTGKPYGLYGVTVDGLWTAEKKTALSEADFVFCRDSISQYFLYQQDLKCPMIGFAPDSTFGMKLGKDASAEKFMKDNGLEPDRFICVVPRMRFTPASFDDEHFNYTDPRRESSAMNNVESDMAKMRNVICHIVEKYGLKVMICPEMTYQVPLGRRYLYDRLPESVKKNVVLKREYWITSEAESVYAKAKMLISMDMHSPIMFIVEHKPAILLRQAEDTWKGQMWRDLGMQDWIFELNVTDAARINAQTDKILQDYPNALKQAAAAGNFALELDRKAMGYIHSILNRI